jgi:hypothetical protein
MVTAISVPENQPVTKQWLQSQVQWLQKTDDVFCVDFLQRVLLLSPPIDPNIEPEAEDYLKTLGTQWIVQVPSTVHIDILTPELYLGSENGLQEIWRLHEDTHEAFIHTFIPDENGYTHKLCHCSESQWLT